MAELILLRGQIALVDDEDLQKVAGFRWYLGKNGYVMAWSKTERMPIYLHRRIMDAGVGEEVDHRFHKLLDNRRSELRKVTPHQQRGNTRGLLSRAKSSVFKGVFWHKNNQKWIAGLKVKEGEKRRWRYLGSFEQEVDAAMAYNAAACDYFGVQYAHVNQV